MAKNQSVGDNCMSSLLHEQFVDESSILGCVGRVA